MEPLHEWGFTLLQHSGVYAFYANTMDHVPPDSMDHMAHRVGVARGAATSEQQHDSSPKLSSNVRSEVEASLERERQRAEQLEKQLARSEEDKKM